MLNKIIILLFFLPARLFAQQPLAEDITGVWKGSLYNDTTSKYLPYEIAISEEKGKLSGYSYTLFDIDGKKEAGVKRIKIIRKGDQLNIEDIELISDTYSARPPKGIKQRSEVSLAVKDTLMQLNGIWNTNPTRDYRPLTGIIQLQRSIDYKPQVLFKKLVELKLDQSLSFVKGLPRPAPDEALIEKSGLPSVVINKPAQNVVAAPGESKPKEIPAPPPVTEPVETFTFNALPVKVITVLSETALIQIPALNRPKVIVSPAAGNRIRNLAVMKLKLPADFAAILKDTAKTIIPKPVEKKNDIAVANMPKKDNNLAVVNNPKIVVPLPVVKTQPAEKPKPTPPPVAVNKPATATIVKEPAKKESKPIAVVPAPEKKKEAVVAKPDPLAANAATNVSERKMKKEESVFFESDSLVLTLYDNGEVDGDTVSVLMNGQIIFARQGLSTKANSKTIYIDKGMPDTLSMIMYAENLGSIPPNTGLLIIMDGNKRYEVRFSADLQTNAAILFRRKTNKNRL